MALKRLIIEGYGVLELNNVVFRRDGNIEAQCALDPADFTDAASAENGMLLAVDRVARLVKLADDDSLPIALNYSAEHMYDERKPGLNKFFLVPGTFYPRLGYLNKGDLFTTNTVSYDDAEYTNDAAVETALEALDTTPVYGKPCANGAIQLTATKPTGAIVLRAVEKTTMPDGQLGIKFQVYSA